MTQFLFFFWQICLLRQGPERAPVSTAFIGCIVGIYAVCSMVLVSIANQDFNPVYSVELALLGLTIQASCTWLLTAYKRLYSRFRATLVSLLGTNSLFILMWIPFNLLLHSTEIDSVIYAIEIVYWLFLIWWIAVAGFILHKALNVSLVQGLALAFTMELLSLFTSISLLTAELSTAT